MQLTPTLTPFSALAADFGVPKDRELSEEALDLLSRIFVAEPTARITLAGIQVRRAAVVANPTEAPCWVHSERREDQHSPMLPGGPHLLLCMTVYLADHGVVTGSGPAPACRVVLLNSKGFLPHPKHASDRPGGRGLQAHPWVAEAGPLDLEAVNGPLAAKCAAAWKPEDEEAIASVVAKAAAAAMEAMGSGELNELELDEILDEEDDYEF